MCNPLLPPTIGVKTVDRTVTLTEVQRALERLNSTRPKSGFEPDPESQSEPCRDPGHEAPTHLYVPAGQRYRHVCPGCGRMVFLYPANVQCATRCDAQ